MRRGSLPFFYLSAADDFYGAMDFVDQAIGLIPTTTNGNPTRRIQSSCGAGAVGRHCRCGMDRG